MKSVRTLAVVVLLLAGTGAVALDILLPNGSTPAQVVSIRKYVMMTNGASAGDLRAKAGSGAIKAAAANARAMAALGSLLPPLFTDTYSGVYPVQGSRYFYKGGAAADFQAAARSFVGAAEELVAAADKEDKAAVDAQAGKLQAACNACHAAFRGQN